MIDIKKIKAHCDIPCAIYDTMPAQYQALSVIRFLDLINEISDSLDDQENLAKFVRLVEQKEVHAMNAKNEITTIWGDYFKEPQISKYPEIHEITHSIMIAASKCKQSLDRQNGIDLLNNINKFSEIFWATKDMETEIKTVPYEPKLEVVCPK
tara:strand:- start:84 stop:542 length:459 start_codon:yes stop_codon:yes gene_type:complete